MSRPDRSTLADAAVFVVPVVALLAFVLWRSTGWRMRHDLPMMMYQAFLMDRFGYLPYRDFFDMNMPGTYATYLLIGKVFGYGDAGMRVADFTWMAAITATTVALLRRCGPTVAALAPATFLLLYLRVGGEITLQREFLALVPVTLGALATTSGAPVRTRALLAGAAFALAATYKPQLGVGLVAVATFLALEVARTGTGRDVARVLGFVAVGFAAPLVLVAAVLAALGVLDDFARALPYLGLYTQLTGTHRALPDGERPAYLATELLKLGGHTPWVLAGAFGYARGLSAAPDDDARRRVGLLAALGALYVVYPVFSGQFWPYHWLPGLYFSAIGTALLLSRSPTPDGSWLPARVALAVLLLQLSQVTEGLGVWDRVKERVPEEGRPDGIAAWLGEHLAEGDTVQPFDWIMGGVCHGLLEARARPATSFLYTFHFYHHTSTPYLRDLRARFLSELQAAPPPYVVMSRVHWPYFRGPDTATEFPAFDRWLADNYQVAKDFDVPEIVVWESRTHASERAP